jgi:hypothetical protein
MNNKYGVDVSYFKKELSALSMSLSDRTPDELSRYLVCLSEVAKPLEAEEHHKTVRPKCAVQEKNLRLQTLYRCIKRLLLTKHCSCNGNTEDFRLCPYCGKRTHYGDRYCCSCGKSLSSRMGK